MWWNIHLSQLVGVAQDGRSRSPFRRTAAKTSACYLFTPRLKVLLEGNLCWNPIQGFPTTLKALDTRDVSARLAHAINYIQSHNVIHVRAQESVFVAAFMNQHLDIPVDSPSIQLPALQSLWLTASDASQDFALGLHAVTLPFKSSTNHNYHLNLPLQRFEWPLRAFCICALVH